MSGGSDMLGNRSWTTPNTTLLEDVTPAVVPVTVRSPPTFHQPSLFQLFAKGAT